MLHALICISKEYNKKQAMVKEKLTLLPPQGAWQKQGWEQLTHMMPTSNASATRAHLCITKPPHILHADECY